MTKKEVIRIFEWNCANSKRCDDRIMMLEEWFTFLDGLQRDGDITIRQYENICPPFTERNFGKWCRKIWGIATR